MKTVSLFIVIALLFSCRSPKKEMPETQNKTPVATIRKQKDTIRFNTIERTDMQILKELNTGITDGGITLFFQQFFIQIDSLGVDDPENKLRDKQNGTAFISLKKGAEINTQKVTVLQNEYDRMAVFQRLENNLFLTDEKGERCDLSQWKSYLSEWKQLPVSGTVFHLASYFPADSEKFEKIDLKAFKKAVNEHCGASFSKSLQKIHSLKDIRKFIKTDKIYLKLILENSKTGKRSENLILFELPVNNL